MRDRTKVKIGVDLDGVIGDWDGIVHTIFEALGYKLKPESPTWDYLQETVSPKDWNWLWSSKGGLNVMFGLEKPYPGARSAMRALRDLGRVHIVTSRPDKAADLTRRWLEEQGIPHDSLTILGPGKVKSAEGPWDFFIDDRDKNVLDIQKVCPRIYLMKRPWNADFPWPLKVKTLGEFADEVEDRIDEVQG